MDKRKVYETPEAELLEIKSEKNFLLTGENEEYEREDGIW